MPDDQGMTLLMSQVAYTQGKTNPNTTQLGSQVQRRGNVKLIYMFVMVLANQRGTRCEQSCGFKEFSGFDLDEALAAKSGQMKKSSQESWIVQDVNEDKTGSTTDTEVILIVVWTIAQPPSMRILGMSHVQYESALGTASRCRW